MLKKRNVNHTNNQKSVSLRPLYLATLLACVASSSAYANIIPNSHLDVIKNNNGSTTININKPGSNGISHNQYKEFDVNQAGLVLNNSATNTDNTLAGQTIGNKNLVDGAASVILNEVVSNKASALNGKIEVAGSKAEVIIANPSGITCNDCGFINANRAMLTTGAPIVQSGNLTGYKVTNGTVTITGKGMNNANVEYTDLVAHVVKINADLWSKDLKITTGRNEIDANNTQLKVLPAESWLNWSKPALALDVSKLGSIYANKISLVGTESGVGVNNKGNIKSANDISMLINGTVHNSGEIASAGQVKILANDQINNSNGTIKAAKDIEIKSNKRIFDNQPGILGTIANLLGQGEKQEFINNQGSVLSEAGDIDIRATSLVSNSNGNLSTYGNITLNSNDVKNVKGQIASVKKATLNSTTYLDNDQGEILATNVLINTGREMSNRGGKINSLLSTEINTLRIKNTSGVVLSNGDVSIKAKSSIENNGGAIYSGNNMLLNTGVALKNQGLIQSVGDMKIISSAKVNNYGVIKSGKDLHIQSKGFKNFNGGKASAEGTFKTTK